MGGLLAIELPVLDACEVGVEMLRGSILWARVAGAVLDCEKELGSFAVAGR